LKNPILHNHFSVNDNTYKMMKAAVRTGWTGFTLEFSDGVEQPQIPKDTKDACLVQVHAAGANPVDCKLPKLALGKVFGLDCRQCE